MAHGTFLNAGCLHSVAIQAYNQSDPERPDRATQNSNRALIATVFAAASLEAFINELPVIAGSLVPLRLSGADSAMLSSLASILDEIEESRGSVKLKYLLAHQVLTGEAWDRGTTEFDNFATLIDLRSAVVRMKPRDRFLPKNGEVGFRFEPHPILRRLENKAILAVDIDENTTTTWLARIDKRATCRWACNAAADTVQIICDAMQLETIEGRGILSFNRVE